MAELTPQEELFCEKYVGNNGNGKQAAIEAGYPAENAEAIGKRLLRRTDIKAELRLYRNPSTTIDPPEYWNAVAKFEA